MKKKQFTEEQVIGILRQAERGEEAIGETAGRTGYQSNPFTAGAGSLGACKSLPQVLQSIT